MWSWLVPSGGTKGSIDQIVVGVGRNAGPRISAGNLSASDGHPDIGAGTPAAGKPAGVFYCTALQPHCLPAGRAVGFNDGSRGGPTMRFAMLPKLIALGLFVTGLCLIIAAGLPQLKHIAAAVLA